MLGLGSQTLDRGFRVEGVGTVWDFRILDRRDLSLGVRSCPGEENSEREGASQKAWKSRAGNETFKEKQQP